MAWVVDERLGRPLDECMGRGRWNCPSARVMAELLGRRLTERMGLDRPSAERIGLG